MKEQKKTGIAGGELPMIPEKDKRTVNKLLQFIIGLRGFSKRYSIADAPAVWNLPERTIP